MRIATPLVGGLLLGPSLALFTAISGSTYAVAAFAGIVIHDRGHAR